LCNYYFINPASLPIEIETIEGEQVSYILPRIPIYSMVIQYHGNAVTPCAMTWALSAQVEKLNDDGSCSTPQVWWTLSTVWGTCYMRWLWPPIQSIDCRHTTDFFRWFFETIGTAILISTRCWH